MLFWLFLILLFFLPLGYGWGYRGWGPPYPSYYHRRRRPAEAYGDTAVADDGWGILADVLWIVLTVWLAWFVLAAIF